jgi:CBS-domain-containing membrane protein
MMVDNDCGCIPVVESYENMKPVGTITDRDIAVRTFTGNRNTLDLTASDVMTADIISIEPEMSIEECCDVMEDAQIRRVLVVDNNGACCGIVAQADIAEYASPHQTAKTVSEISDVSPKAGKTSGNNVGNNVTRKNTSHIERVLPLIIGLGSGAALMYFLDPNGGRRRRSLVGDQITSITTNAQKAFGKIRRDLQNRTKGALIETKKAVIGNTNDSENRNGEGIEAKRAAAQK